MINEDLKQENISDISFDKLTDIEDQVLFILETIQHSWNEIDDRTAELRNLLMETKQKTSDSWDIIIKLLEKE
jgi:hypothetical protein